MTPQTQPHKTQGRGKHRLFPAIHLLFLASTLVACDESFEEERKPLPILVRQTVPADSVLVPKGEAFTLSIRFNRPVKLDEVHANIYPEPLALPRASLSPTAHTMFFDGVQLNPEASIHQLLIDGKSVVQPEIATWWDGQTELGRVGGFIRLAEPERVRSEDFLVFLLPPDTGYEPDKPPSFELARPLLVTPPSWDIEEIAFHYQFHSLPDGKPFYVVAIVDTNEDGNYEPERDWWGAYGVAREQPFLFLEPVTTITQIGTEGDQDYNFSLKPPGTLW